MKIEILRPFVVGEHRGQCGDVIDVPFSLAEALIKDQCAQIAGAKAEVNVVEPEDSDDDKEESGEDDDEPASPGAEERTSVAGIDDIFNAQNEVTAEVSPEAKALADAASVEAEAQKPKAKK